MSQWSHHNDVSPKTQRKTWKREGEEDVKSPPQLKGSINCKLMLLLLWKRCIAKQEFSKLWKAVRYGTGTVCTVPVRYCIPSERDEHETQRV